MAACRTTDQFVTPDDISSDLLCSIGKGVMTEPVATTCGHRFCSKCISRSLGSSTKCPVCSAEVDPGNIKPLADARDSIASLQTHCSNRGKGCQWSGSLGDLPSHLGLCLRLLPVLCDMCQENVPRDQMNQHFSVCPKRPTNCPVCNQELTADQLQQHQQEVHAGATCDFCKQVVSGSVEAHQKHCSAAPSKCSFCNEEMPKKDLIRHQQECPSQPAVCPLCQQADFTLRELEDHKTNKCPAGQTSCDGCKKKMTRSELAKHVTKCSASKSGPCDLCGVIVPNSQLMQHLSQSCGKSLVTCEYCRVKVERDEMNNNHKNTCQLWPNPCQYCEKEVIRKDEAKHLTICPQAPKQCTHCSAQIARSELAEHINSTCNMAPTACEHCLMKFPRQDLPDHLSVCGSKKVTCTNCNKEMKEFELHTHQCGDAAEGPATTTTTTTSPANSPPPAAAPSSSSSSSVGSGGGGGISNNNNHGASSGSISGSGGGGGGCPFAQFGCRWQSGGVDCSSHVSESVADHLGLLVNEVATLKAENTFLKKEIEVLRGSSGTTRVNSHVDINSAITMLENRLQLLESNTGTATPTGVGVTGRLRSPGAGSGPQRATPTNSSSPITNQNSSPSGVAVNMTPPTPAAAQNPSSPMSSGAAPPPSSLVDQPASAQHRRSLTSGELADAIGCSSLAPSTSEEQWHSDDDGRVQCPTCLRKFNEVAAQKHIPNCHAKPVNHHSPPKTSPKPKGTTRPTSKAGGGGSRPVSQNAATANNNKTSSEKKCQKCGTRGSTKFCTICGGKLV